MATEAQGPTRRRASTTATALKDNLPALVWYVDPEFGGRGFNQAWWLFSGVGEASLSGDGWLGLIHPDDRPKLAFLKEGASSVGTPRSLDIRLQDQKGHYRWFLVNSSGVNPCSSRALVAVSIEDRKSAELERELELSDVRAMLDNAPTMMWRTTASGEMDYANERYLRAWDRSLDEVKGW